MKISLITSVLYFVNRAVGRRGRLRFGEGHWQGVLWKSYSSQKDKRREAVRDEGTPFYHVENLSISCFVCMNTFCL